MVIDPWGTVIAKARDEAGMFYADIDLDYEDKVSPEGTGTGESAEQISTK